MQTEWTRTKSANYAGSTWEEGGSIWKGWVRKISRDVYLEHGMGKTDTYFAQKRTSAFLAVTKRYMPYM